MSTATSFGTDIRTKAQDKLATAAGKAKETASNFGKDLRNTAEDAKETASSLVDQAKDMASAVAETAGNVATAVGHTAQDAASAVGDALGKAGSAVASTVESGGRFLKDQGLTAAEDITALIRRNPIPAVLIGIGAGYLLARAIHRS
jgi:hypothetical protein